MRRSVFVLLTWCVLGLLPSATGAEPSEAKPEVKPETKPAAGASAPVLPTVPASVLEAESARVAVMAKAKQSAVAIFSADGQGGGSGVVITADGYALSNFHVAKPCGDAMKCGMADGKVYDAVVVGLDPTGDVALIRLLGRDDFPHAEMGDSDLVRQGDWVFAMGNPFLLATDFQPTVTYGIVSGVHRYQFPAGTLLEYADCIQTDASINPGNSGGPLFDAQGQLIGINGRASFEKRGRVNVGVGYAISINQIKNFLGYLRSGRIVDHANLNARVTSDENSRVVISDILEESDAFRRGLRYDDEIVSFGGRAITTPNAFKNALGVLPKGWRVPLTYRREGKRTDILVRLGGIHRAEELIQKAMGPSPEMMPVPKPAEDPEPKSDKEKGKKAKTPEPKPIKIEPRMGKPLRAATPKAPMPEIAKKNFEAKRGYANYHFNKVERERVWKAFAARSNFAGLDGPWTLSGKLESGGAFKFRLAEDGASLDAPVGNITWTATNDLTASLAPPGSGGLLPALYLWRRLAVTGIDRFGDLYYLGAAPLARHRGLADVLVGVSRGVECWFYFDPASGQMLAMEFFAGENSDPCEIYFSEYREVEGRMTPGLIEVRLGDDPYGSFRIGEAKFERTTEKK